MRTLLLLSSSAVVMIAIGCFFWTMCGPLEGEEKATFRWLTLCSLLISILLRLAALTMS